MTETGMHTLAHQQQLLLDALFAWPAGDAIKKIAPFAIDTKGRGLKAYQANGHALAERALRSAYPVLAQLVGDESFADLARALWHAHAPQCGDIAQWGHALPVFLRNSAQLQDEPYLPDVAAAEWALHQCASAPNAAADLASLALLTKHEPEELQCVLAPGCALVCSSWPIVSILGAHRDQTPSFAEVGHELQAGVAQDAVVWRCGLQPRVRLALAGEAALVAVLLQGGTLAQALEAAPDLDFQVWLPTAVHGGLVLAVAYHPE